jgi:hypothetical protein
MSLAGLLKNVFISVYFYDVLSLLNAFVGVHYVCLKSALIMS